MKEDHDDAADRRHADDAELQKGQRREVRPLGAEPGADHEAEQGLHEDDRLEMPAHEIAEAACGGDRQDDQHAGADGLQERHAEDDHERELDVGRRTDAEGAGDEAADQADGEAVGPELLSGQQRLPHVHVAVKPVRLIDLDVEDDGAQEEHEAGDRAQKISRHEIGKIRAGDGPADAADAEHEAGFEHDLMLAQVADGARKHREDHRSEGHGECGVDRHMEAHDEERDRDAGSAGPDEADKRAERQHRSKEHKDSPVFLKDFSAVGVRAPPAEHTFSFYRNPAGLVKSFRARPFWPRLVISGLPYRSAGAGQ